MALIDDMEFCFNEAEKRFKFLSGLGFSEPVRKSGGLWGSLSYRGDKISIHIQFELDRFFIFLTVSPAGKEGYNSKLHLINILRKLGLDNDYQSKTIEFRDNLEKCAEFLDVYVIALRENLAKIIEKYDLIFENE